MGREAETGRIGRSGVTGWKGGKILASRRAAGGNKLKEQKLRTGTMTQR